MTFHESLWLATAAAAPVIALAAVVVLPDTSDIYQSDVEPIVDKWFGTPARLRAVMEAAGVSDSIAAKATSDLDLSPLKAEMAKSLKPIRRLAMAIRWTAIGNVIMQAALLALSLGALAYNADAIPRPVPIVLTTGGILLLAVTVTLASDYHKMGREFQQTFDQQMTEAFEQAVVAARGSAKKTAEGSAQGAAEGEADH